ncbi:PREDICTED: beta-defensin 1-like [Chinchilla lanigera]|uniref:beta-defensin 1-like n=1 Tax=Chinchilla lanigera TaxID=34839 RepID=UPI000695E0C5|nr:PREDICTED: beta-defensin 1-like [Chinchilla lanigera]
MRTHCLLLMVFCFLDFHIAPGAGLLAGFNARADLGGIPDTDKCINDGGSCVYYNCPIYSKIIGSCYDGEAKCCV